MKTLWLPLVFAALLRGQAETITEERVREAVSWLAADERGGRDTPSAGLEQAAQWLAERFAAAGLQRAVPDSWFHAYVLPGLVLDSRAVKLELTRNAGRDDEKRFELEPDRDVRLWRGSDALEGALEAATVAPAADAALQQLVRAQSGRRPIVIEVDEAHAHWQLAAGERSVLGSRRAAARPVFLVRKGILPPPPPRDEREPQWAATWKVPPAPRVDIAGKNVVALLPGAEKREEFVVVSAHYDHIGIGPGDGDAIHNGADDDATGTAAVVLIAEAMSKQPPPARSVLFVCFSAEEKGLRGSRAFVENPPANVKREQIVANVNLEMLGRPEPGKRKQAWVTGADLSEFAAIAREPLQRHGVELVDFALAAQLFGASDNWSFVERGIVAHSISAGSLHEDYHRPGDEAGKIDVAHMTAVVRALCAVVRELADRDAPPAWNDKGRERLAKLRR